MNPAIESRASRTIGRIKQIWSEFDYAQRRLFEIRTGIPSIAPEKGPMARDQIDELERLYAYRGQRPSEC